MQSSSIDNDIKYEYIRVFDPPPAYRIMNLDAIRTTWRYMRDNNGAEEIRIKELSLTLYRADLPNIDTLVTTHITKKSSIDKQMRKKARRAQSRMNRSR